MAQTSCMTHTQYVQASHYVNKSVTGVDQVLHLCLLYLYFGSTALENKTIVEHENTTAQAPACPCEKPKKQIKKYTILPPVW